jgi:hypothetical protein
LGFDFPLPKILLATKIRFSSEWVAFTTSNSDLRLVIVLRSLNEWDQ